MNKIDEMIRELCPEGVKRVKLGEVCEVSDYVSNGSFATLKANVKYLSEPNYAVLLRFADYSNNFDASKFVYIDEHAYNFLNKSKLFGGEIIISNVGSCGLLFRCPKLNTKMSLAPNTIMVKSKYQDYLYYWLKSKSGQESMLRFVSPGAMPKFNKTQFKTIEIPLPPLAIQQEIVSILDSFSSLQSKLEEELAVRQKQMEFYREKLLTFDKDDNSVKWMTLPQISTNRDNQRKPITSTHRKKGVYPYYGASGIVDYVEGFIFDGDYLLISEDGANLVARTMPIAFAISGKNWVNNHAHVIEFNNYCTQRYVEMYFNRLDLTPWITGGAQPKLNQERLNKISIPLPPLSRQQEIVSTLDTMSSLIDKLKEEIELRKKQYEYYREALLSF